MEVLLNDKNITILKNKNYLYLFSYNTRIAWYNTKNYNLFLTNAWDYSQSTLKHLKYFINNYIEEGYYKSKKDFESRIAKNNSIHLVKE